MILDALLNRGHYPTQGLAVFGRGSGNARNSVGELLGAEFAGYAGEPKIEMADPEAIHTGQRRDRSVLRTFGRLNLAEQRAPSVAAVNFSAAEPGR